MKGKKGVTIALNTVGVAILTMAVVLVVGAIFYDHAPAIADSTIGPLKHLIGIGDPEILDLRVEQDPQSSKDFKIHYEIGNLDSLKEAKIVKIYKKYENSNPSRNGGNGWDIDLDTLKDAYGVGLITDSLEAGYNEYEIILTGDEEISKSELVKVYDENYLEMHNTSLEKCQHTRLQAGGPALLRTEVTGDGMWKPLGIRGIIHYDNKQCDVIECKKNGLTVKHPNYLDDNNYDWPFYCFAATKDYLKLVSKELVEIHGGSEDCGGFGEEDYVKAYIKYSGCNDNQINELSKRMVTVHFIAAACEIIALREPGYLEEIRDEGINIRDIHLSYEEFQKAKESAIGMTMACTRRHEETYNGYYDWQGRYNIGIPGTLSHFTNEGFIQIGELTEHEESINKIFSEDIRPGFVEYLVGEYPTIQNEKRFGAVWKIIGHEKVNWIEVDHCWSKYAIDEDFMDQVQVGDRECYQSSHQARESRSAERFENPEPGMYIATFKMETNEGEVITRTAKGGIYNDNYIENYRGVYTYYNKENRDNKKVITVCVENPEAGDDDENDQCHDGPGKRNLAECDEKCGVNQKKLDAFRIENAPGDKNDRPPDTKEFRLHNDTFKQWKDAKERNGQSTGCIFKHHQEELTRAGPFGAADNHYYLLAGCSPEEVNELYDLLLSKAVSEIVSCRNIGTILDCHNSFYKDENTLGSCIDEMKNRFEIKKDELVEVCNAKIMLKGNLETLKWKDLRDTY